MREASDSVVRVAVSGDAQRAQDYLPRALALLQRTQERARVYGVTGLSDQLRLDDDAYCYVTVAPGINQVNVVVDVAATAEASAVQPTEIPDFLSGVVRNGYLTSLQSPDGQSFQVLGDFHPTDATAARFGADAAFQPSRRLAVEPYPDVAYTPIEADGTPSQYTEIRPTMYSGRMRRLVQALLGFGRQRAAGGAEASIYAPATEQQRQALAPTAYQQEVVRQGLQIRYDWRFSRTHGVTVGADGTFWLVEIGITRGVLAWPMPLNERTTTEDFRKQLEDAADQEALTLLDEFGGFPTGESLPAAAQTAAWVRAGRLLQLVSAEAMQEFYDYTAYSSWLGWAFNLQGDEAHNTAWRYGDDGVRRGAHYMVPIKIGAIEAPVPQPGAASLKQAFAGLSGSTYQDGLAAAAWKVGRLSESQMRQALDRLGRSADEAYSYVDALELDPMAPASAHLSQVSEGALWPAPPSASAAPPVKTAIWFPAPELGRVSQFDMQPLAGAPTQPPDCDTTVFVCFHGDELRWAKFYLRRLLGPAIDDSPTSNGATRPENMASDVPCDQEGNVIYGTSVYKALGLSDPESRPYYFSSYYTNEFDDRSIILLSGLEEDIYTKTVDDLGVLGVLPGAISAAPEPGSGQVLYWQARGMNVTAQLEHCTYADARSAIAVPLYDREAYYYALLSRPDSKFQLDNIGRNFMGPLWVVDPEYWRGTPIPGSQAPFPDNYTWTSETSQVAYTSRGWAGTADGDFAGDVSSAMYEWSNRGGWGPPTGSSLSGTGAYSETTDGGYNTINPPPFLQHSIWLSASSTGVICTRRDTRITTDMIDASAWPWVAADAGNNRLEATGNVLGRATSYRCTGGLGAAGAEDERDLMLFGSPQWDGTDTGLLTYIGVIHG